MPESNRMCRNGCNYLPFSLRWLHADSLLKVSQGTKESRREALLSLIERATGKAVYRGETSDEPEGIQRTALMPDETAVKRNGKTFRMSLGPTSGGAIKFDPDEDVTQGICIGEGVETCLSGRT